MTEVLSVRKVYSSEEFAKYSDMIIRMTYGDLLVDIEDRMQEVKEIRLVIKNETILDESAPVVTVTWKAKVLLHGSETDPKVIFVEEEGDDVLPT